MATKTFSIFISHVDEDGAIALAMKTFLEELFLNAQCFVSGWDLAGGELWFEELRKQLESSVCIVALISPISKDSRWVHFEAGAGFVTLRTIPIAVAPLTVDTLPAPLKLLQARNLTREGLEALSIDIARLAKLRTPARFPGLDEALGEIDSFLKKRLQPSIPSTTAATSARQTLFPPKPAEDLAIKAQLGHLQTQVRSLLIELLERSRASFDIPSQHELRAQNLMDLFEIADAVGAPTPFQSRWALTFDTAVAADAPEWKKINERKQLGEVERELVKFAADNKLGAAV
jgi:hypothetical protein